MLGLNLWWVSALGSLVRGRCSWAWAAACMRCMADAAARAWLRSPPVSSQAATHKADAAVVGAAKVRWCMGSKTVSGGLIGMAFLRYVPMSASMEAQYDWFPAKATAVGV